MKNDTLIVIPVRMGSSRFPGKPLIDINGEAMIYHVWEKAILSKCGNVVVACCDNIIKKYLIKKEIPYVMTNKNLNSGTDRAYQALQKVSKHKKYTYIINLQGDLPNIEPSSIKKVASTIKHKHINMATLVSKIKDIKKIKDTNVVKVALSKKGKLSKAVYFSRSPIPYNADVHYEHIGIYAYNINTLKKLTSLHMGELEKMESLEQLRALENDIKIYVEKIDKVPLSIDTPQDLKNFLKLRKK